MDPRHGRGISVFSFGKGHIFQIIHQPGIVPGQALDKGIDDIDQHVGDHHRQRDFPKGRPRRRPFHLGRLIHRDRNRLDTGEENQDLHPAAVDHVDDIVGGAGDPLNKRRAEIELLQNQRRVAERAQHGAVLIGSRAVHDAHDHVFAVHHAEQPGAGNDRQKEQRAKRGSSPNLGVEDDGDKEGKHQNDGGRGHQRPQVLRQILDKVGVHPQGIMKVFQAGKGELQTVLDADVGKGKPDAGDHHLEKNKKQTGQERGNKDKTRPLNLPAPAALPRAGYKFIAHRYAPFVKRYSSALPLVCPPARRPCGCSSRRSPPRFRRWRR